MEMTALLIERGARATTTDKVRSAHASLSFFSSLNFFIVQEDAPSLGLGEECER